MGLSEDIRRQLIESFKTEQQEHIQNINRGLLALEKNPKAAGRQAYLDEIFREAHSLKGAARAVGMTTVESLGHALEDILLKAKEGRLAFSSELFDLMYQALDAVELMMGQLEAGNSAPPISVLTLLARLEEAQHEIPPAPAAHPLPKEQITIQQTQDPAEAPEEIETAYSAATHTPRLTDTPIQPAQPDETIRVSVNKLDALMNQFGELVSAKIRAEQRLAEVHAYQLFSSEWQKSWQTYRNHYNRLLRSNPLESLNGHGKDFEALMAFITYNQDQLGLLAGQSNALFRQLSNDTQRLSLIINELQEEIKRVRMLPLSTITVTFERMVRDLAREQSKQIAFNIIGGETELDKRVLEQIKDPLIHLLRNAIDHGIEPPQDRQQAGKAATGSITLSAGQQGNNVVITIKDNGRGLDIPAIRQSSVRKGLLSQSEAEKLGDAQAANLIFNAGLSTSKIITDISGRGVGLDVVRRNIEALHGTLAVTSIPEQSATFTLTLPLTLASSRGLLVRSGGQTFALPLTTVERMLQIDRSRVASVEGREAITYQETPVALAWLEDLLELPPGSREREQITVVIVTVAEKRLGLIVDDLIGEQEIVIKALGKQLNKVGGIAGATTLGSGEVVLVLHTADLVKLAARTASTTSLLSPARRDETPHQKTILVVDDSITTRTLEKNILEAVGYQVRLATDGEEAFSLLVADQLPDLIISDVNMPRLDGFQLTDRIKQDGRFSAIPVILVTSLDSPADKARGIEVGADAYIVKSRFEQGNLLETIDQLV